MSNIPLAKCFLNDEIKQAVLRVLDSGNYILQDDCKAFEKELAAHTGTSDAVLGTSWTMCVYILHRVQGLKPGDEVIVPSHTAYPTIEPLIHWGARPVFVDIDDTYCMDPEAVAAAVTPRTVGIIPVHLYGHPADLDRILPIAEKNGLWVLEDCAQAQGAQHNGRTVGSIGHHGAFSFYPSKNLTVLADGGCITTSDAQVAEQLRMLRNHGRKEKFTHEAVGYNVRFNDVQAAIGRIALQNLDRLNDGRRAVADRYRENLKGLVETPIEKSYARAVYHMYVVKADRRDDLAAHLKSKGIGTGIHYPVANHQQPGITSLFDNIPSLPRTEAVVDQILSLPIHGELTMDEVDQVCEAVTGFYKG